MTSRLFGSMTFVPMNEGQLRRWESRRRGGPVFYAVIWGVGVSGLFGFCVATAFLYFYWHMNLGGTVFAASSFAFVVGLIVRWNEWHAQENRFRITMKMNEGRNPTSIERDES